MSIHPSVCLSVCVAANTLTSSGYCVSLWCAVGQDTATLDYEHDSEAEWEPEPEDADECKSDDEDDPEEDECVLLLLLFFSTALLPMQLNAGNSENKSQQTTSSPDCFLRLCLLPSNLFAFPLPVAPPPTSTLLSHSACLPPRVAGWRVQGGCGRC